MFPDAKSRNVELRNSLDLFVNVLHVKSFPGVTMRHDNIDIMLIRQNTEGEPLFPLGPKEPSLVCSHMAPNCYMTNLPKL